MTQRKPLVILNPKPFSTKGVAIHFRSFFLFNLALLLCYGVCNFVLIRLLIGASIMVAFSRLRSRSKPIHLESLGQRLKKRLAQEKQIQHLFKASSQDVSLDHDSIAKWSSFPLTADGHLDVNFSGGSSEQVGRMKRRINQLLVYDAAHYGGETQQVWSGFLRKTFPFMSSWPLDKVLLALAVRVLYRVLYQRHLGNADLDFIEYYCGRGELTKAGLRHGLKGFAFDVVLHPEHDALSVEGLALYLAALAGTTPCNGLAWHSLLKLYSALPSTKPTICRFNVQGGLH